MNGIFLLTNITFLCVKMWSLINNFSACSLHVRNAMQSQTEKFGLLKICYFIQITQSYNFKLSQPIPCMHPSIVSKYFCLWLWRLWLWSTVLPNRTRNLVVIYYYLDKWWAESYSMEILHIVPVTKHYTSPWDNFPLFHSLEFLFHFIHLAASSSSSFQQLPPESRENWQRLHGYRCLDRLRYSNKQNIQK